VTESEILSAAHGRSPLSKSEFDGVASTLTAPTLMKK
jgi:hypothetical protein